MFLFIPENLNLRICSEMLENTGKPLITKVIKPIILSYSLSLSKMGHLHTIYLPSESFCSFKFVSGLKEDVQLKSVRLPDLNQQDFFPWKHRKQRFDSPTKFSWQHLPNNHNWMSKNNSGVAKQCWNQIWTEPLLLCGSEIVTMKRICHQWFRSQSKVRIWQLSIHGFVQLKTQFLQNYWTNFKKLSVSKNNF